MWQFLNNFSTFYLTYARVYPLILTEEVSAQEAMELASDSLTEHQTLEDPDPTGGKDDHIVGGEEMVVLDDALEAEREDNLDHQISTTSDDVLVGISGEGAELHPEFDDFEDDQQYEVLETADGDFSGESLSVEQSPSVGERSPDDRKEDLGGDGDGGKREKSSPEKSGTVYIIVCECSPCMHVCTLSNYVLPESDVSAFLSPYM